jgi:hypothetical protein
MEDIVVTLQREDEGYSVVQDVGYALSFPYIPFYRTLTPAVIPSCAAWFDPLTIHQVEVDSLPEYFNGKFPSKTPSVYMTYRNFIIKLYRDKPTGYLTATQCRRLITGDACSIIRLHAFLEHWGLVNLYAEKPYSQPAYDFAWPGHMSYGRKRLYELGRPFCGSCGNICGVTWMHNPDLILCNDCYEKGNYDLISDQDFQQENLLKHFNYSSLIIDDKWDHQKTADLITALKRLGEDWEKVAQAVGVDKSQVIAKYLSLPLQDLIEAENEKEDDYQDPLTTNDKEFGVQIDMKLALENAKIARKNEEIEIDRILNEMIEIQSKKVEIKSRFINEMKDMLEIKLKSTKMKMQQMVNSNYLIALSKSRGNGLGN